MSQPSLTERQREILAFVRRYLGINGRNPTHRDVCAEFGFASPEGAACHLRALERKGFLKKYKDGGNRGYGPAVKEGHCPCCGQALPSEVVPSPGPMGSGEV